MSSTHILASLDLEQGVTWDNRQKFNQKLQELGWIKHPKVTTTWSICTNLTVTHDQLVQLACADLGKASSAANSARLNAVLMVGNTEPIPVSNIK